MKSSKLGLYLVMLGTDQPELLFSSVSTITHSRNCDILELIDSLNMAYQIEIILNKYPELRKYSRLDTQTKKELCN
jgi:hypothetical protein